MSSPTTSFKLKGEFHRSHSFLFVQEREGADACFDKTECPYSCIDARWHMWHYGNRLARDWLASFEDLRSEWSASMDQVREGDLHG